MALFILRFNSSLNYLGPGAFIHAGVCFSCLFGQTKSWLEPGWDLDGMVVLHPPVGILPPVYRYHLTGNIFISYKIIINEINFSGEYLGVNMFGV